MRSQHGTVTAVVQRPPLMLFLRPNAVGAAQFVNGSLSRAHRARVGLGGHALPRSKEGVPKEALPPWRRWLCICCVTHGRICRRCGIAHGRICRVFLGGREIVQHRETSAWKIRKISSSSL